MENNSERNDRLRYYGPKIISIGDAIALTGYVGSPVRDNPLVDKPAYYNANPADLTAEIDLDD